MNTMKIQNTTYTIKGELPNGAFYLEGPKGGALLAKPVAGVYTFHTMRGNGAIHHNGTLVTATREQLAA